MKRKIAAIMAADIAGYSRLVAEDEEETLRRLAAYRSVFDDFIAKASGRIFNTAGDAVLAEFASAVEAVRCAIDIQESLRTRNLAYPQSRQMNFRIGITVGDIVERDGDLLGDGVNIAARLEGIADPGGICVSRSVYEQVANKLSVQFADIGEQQVKNIPTPIHAYVVAVTLPHEQALSLKKEKASLLPAAAALAAVAVLGGAGGIYWILARSPPPARTPAVASAPATAVASAPVPATSAPMPPPAAVAATPVPASPAPVPAPQRQPTTQVAAVPPPHEAARFNDAKVRALAGEFSIPLPQTIRVVEPSSDVSTKLADYLGAWGGDRRWGGRGRHMILLVTHVDPGGKATGIISFGPPTPTTYNQSPANYWTFTATFADEELKFLSPDGKWTYRFRIMPDGIMQGRLVNPDNHPSMISVERIN
jgi:adenylate cyclase